MKTIKDEAINAEFWRRANKFRDELHKKQVARLKRAVKLLESGKLKPQ